MKLFSGVLGTKNCHPNFRFLSFLFTQLSQVLYRLSLSFTNLLSHANREISSTAVKPNKTSPSISIIFLGNYAQSSTNITPSRDPIMFVYMKGFPPSVLIPDKKIVSQIAAPSFQFRKKPRSSSVLLLGFFLPRRGSSPWVTNMTARWSMKICCVQSLFQTSPVWGLRKALDILTRNGSLCCIFCSTYCSILKTVCFRHPKVLTSFKIS